MARKITLGVCVIILLFLVSKLSEANPLLFFTPFLFSQPVEEPSTIAARKDPVHLDGRMINWIKSNISQKTRMPYSFQVPAESSARVYSTMGGKNSVNGVIERVIVNEGLVIYDGAVAQIALSMAGNEDDLKLAQIPVDIYWKGQLGDLLNIRTGYSTSAFIYDPDDPEAVSGRLKDEGRRGFIYRIINANGSYNSVDPLDGKKSLKGFPVHSAIHWEDWKPVAGENAWVVMAALHIYHQKFYNSLIDGYIQMEDSVELKLAEELAHAALVLQAENGAIRMAPIGTYSENDSFSQEGQKGRWWYNQISSENNISWYAAFRMLYTITQNRKYRAAMEKIEGYLRNAYNSEEHYFYQGMHYINGQWKPNDEHFATDVQTWGISVLTPKKIDSWFGEGESHAIWQTAKKYSAVKDQDNNLIGVGYTKEHDRLSVEWTAGAILAARDLADYYRDSNSLWCQDSALDANQMRKGIDSLRFELADDKAAYSYSSRRGWIPFGWNSHDPQVLSLASTGWVAFIDSNFNPFRLGNQNTVKKMSHLLNG